MQSILALDLSQLPVEVTLSKVNGTLIEVQERKTVSVDLLGDLELLCQTDLSAVFARRLSGLNGGRSAGAKDGSNEADASSQEEHTSVDPVYSVVQNSVAELRAQLDSLEGIWSACCVTVPAYHNLSINVRLPFGDSRSINRIVDLEVQDLLPFDVGEFSVQYACIGPWSTGQSPAVPLPSDKSEGGQLFDVHVGLLPRLLIKNLLALCKAVGLEPNIMSTPAGTVGAVYHIARDYFKENSAILFGRGEQFHLVSLIEGQVRVEHTIQPDQFAGAMLNGNGAHHSYSNAAQFDPSDRYGRILTSLKLILASIERKYGTRLHTLFVLDKQVRATQLQQAIGRRVETFDLKDVLKCGPFELGIGPLGTVFASDDSPAPSISNFRTREFSFSPHFGEVLRALHSSWKYLVIALGSICLVVAGVYAAREYRLVGMKADLLAQIRTIIPNFDPPDGDIRAGLLQAETKLSEDLGVLGSPAKFTPLDALLKITKQIPDVQGFTINSIKISGARAQVVGFVPEVSAAEKFQRDLKKVFGKVNPPSTTPNGNRFNFVIDIVLSQ